MMDAQDRLVLGENTRTHIHREEQYPTTHTLGWHRYCLWARKISLSHHRITSFNIGGPIGCDPPSQPGAGEEKSGP